jgi:hypothetical protein
VESRKNLRDNRVSLHVEELEARLAPANNPNLSPPALNSLPTARATLYLDFTGHFDPTFTNLSGTYTNVDTPPFDRDGNPNNFSAAERSEIIAIWRWVSEDFAPYNINVSTVEPRNFLPRTAQRVAVGGDGNWAGGGLLGISSFNSWFTGTTVTKTIYAFSRNSTNTQEIADTISHEFGHALSLHHQSVWLGGVLINPYYPGPGDDTFPTMGAGIPPGRSLWWYGQNDISQTTFQNELAIIGNATNGFGFRADDAGNTFASAKFLNIVTRPPNNIAVTGVITTMADRDVYKVNALAGPISLTVDVPEPYNNLDPRLELYDRNGLLLAVSDPANTVNYDATINYTGTYNGFYYIVVASAGLSANAQAGFDYGFNVGTYTLRGSIQPYITTLNVHAPLRWTYNPRTGVFSGIATIISSVTLPGAYSLTVTLPSDTIRILSPNAIQSGRIVTFRFNTGLVANQPASFLITLTNPLRLNLGTFYNSFLTNYIYS